MSCSPVIYAFNERDWPGRRRVHHQVDREAIANTGLQQAF
jgi:hypothetical protein